MKPNESALVYNTLPVVSELNRVPKFDPLRFLKQTASGPVMELKYKKLWFRLKYPNGRIKLSTLKITEQLAIIEARVFFDKNDAEPISAFTAQSDKANAPGGLYIETAQHRAVDQALTDAGFGIQFVPDNTGAAVNTATVAPTPAQPKAAAAAKEDTPVEPASQAPAKVTKEVPAPAVTQPVAEEVIQQPVAVPVEEAPVVEQPVLTPVAPEPIREVTPVVAAPAPAVPVTVAAPVQETPVPMAGGYTNEMSVEEICARMTLEEAENYIVPLGTCNGQTMGQVADRRPASLRYYMTGYSGDNNILRAAATVVSQSRLQKAS